MSRKDILRGSAPAERIAERPARVKVRPMLGSTPPPADSSAATRLTSQLGNAFVESKARFERAEDIERRLAEGQAIIEMDPSVIDPSFVEDRMEGDISGLLESIREQGQQIPILIRPHPADKARFQVAFGHRRLRAVVELGRQVKAIVRDLSDEELVIAQGQENNERQDLTFIEKARFASRLNSRFSRDVIAASLSMDKTLLSRMLVLVEAIPDDLIRAIGPAPGIGRPSWQQMADFIEKASAPEDITKFASSKEIQDLPSPERFKAVLALKGKKPSRALPQLLSTSTGARLAQFTQNKIKLDISIDKRVTPGFAAFVLEHLPALYEEHLAKQKPKAGD